jgi:hypothetical protein
MLLIKKYNLALAIASRQREYINELEAYHGGKMRIMFPTRRSTLSHIFGQNIMVLLVLLSLIACSVEASLVNVDCMKHNYHENINFANSGNTSFMFKLELCVKRTIFFGLMMRRENLNNLDATQCFRFNLVAVAPHCISQFRKNGLSP